MGLPQQSFGAGLEHGPAALFDLWLPASQLGKETIHFLLHHCLHFGLLHSVDRGGNHPTARRPSPPDRPRRRRQPTGQWYGHPVPAPRPPPPQSSLGPKAIGHAIVPAPGVSAPSTFAAADHQHPFATVPETPASLSYPTPTPLCFPSRLSHLLPSFT